MPLSKSQLDRVGERLKAGSEIAYDDRATFVEYRATFAPALTEIQELVARELGVSPGSRLKTLETSS